MANEQLPPEFVSLLECLKTSRGFDFTGYKDKSLMRRIRKRMQTIGVEDYAEYTDYLEVHPDEFAQLFDTVLINVTAFFRDPEAWDYLRDVVLPKIFDNAGPSRPLRVWSAGCASGQEAYSLAILFAEALGDRKFRERVKIYATDVDENALQTARLATYSEQELAGVAPELVEKYFERSGTKRTFRHDLRRCVIFGRHDLLQDAPISHIDLLLCRNTLMYFNAEAQAKVLGRFHFGLVDHGYLFVGKAEMLLAHAAMFQPVEVHWRIFQKLPRRAGRDRMVMLPAAPAEAEEVPSTMLGRLRESSFENNPIPELVLERSGRVALANQRARQLFGLELSDLGSLVQDLQLSYRPVELRSHIDRALNEKHGVHLQDVEWPAPGAEARVFDVQVTPLIDAEGVVEGVSLTFPDMTNPHRLKRQLQQSRLELETAYEQLQSANEELETTNEELQSTVEELETTNEELQSSNEELETMNEELQSTNEELRHLNDELQQRTREYIRASSFMEAVLIGLQAGLVVVDDKLTVLVWNPGAADLWGLRGDEVVGRTLTDLDIGLPISELLAPIRKCTEEGLAQELTLEAMNRRGRPILLDVLISPLTEHSTVEHGAILLMADVRRKTTVFSREEGDEG